MAAWAGVRRPTRRLGFDRGGGGGAGRQSHGSFDPQEALVQLALAFEHTGQGAGDGVHSFLFVPAKTFHSKLHYE